jgi:hypothetical protein
MRSGLPLGRMIGCAVYSCRKEPIILQLRLGPQLHHRSRDAMVNATNNHIAFHQQWWRGYSTTLRGKCIDNVTLR